MQSRRVKGTGRGASAAWRTRSRTNDSRVEKTRDEAVVVVPSKLLRSPQEIRFLIMDIAFLLPRRYPLPPLAGPSPWTNGFGTLIISCFGSGRSTHSRISLPSVVSALSEPMKYFWSCQLSLSRVAYGWWAGLLRCSISSSGSCNVLSCACAAVVVPYRLLDYRPTAKACLHTREKLFVWSLGTKYNQS